MFGVVAQLKGQINAARQVSTGDALMDAARSLRSELRNADPDRRSNIQDEIGHIADELRGDPLADTKGGDPSGHEYDPAREKRADAFINLLQGMPPRLMTTLNSGLRRLTIRPELLAITAAP